MKCYELNDPMNDIWRLVQWNVSLQWMKRSFNHSWPMKWLITSEVFIGVPDVFLGLGPRGSLGLLLGYGVVVSGYGVVETRRWISSGVVVTWKHKQKITKCVCETLMLSRQHSRNGLNTDPLTCWQCWAIVRKAGAQWQLIFAYLFLILAFGLLLLLIPFWCLLFVNWFMLFAHFIYYFLSPAFFRESKLANAQLYFYR